MCVSQSSGGNSEELLEGPAKVLSEEITAKLDELPKHAAMVPHARNVPTAERSFLLGYRSFPLGELLGGGGKINLKNKSKITSNIQSNIKQISDMIIRFKLGPSPGGIPGNNCRGSLSSYFFLIRLDAFPLS